MATLLLCAAAQTVLPAQRFTTLASFEQSDGVEPGSLVQGLDGNLYGTATAGGSDSSQCPSSSGCGTVFKVSTSGELTLLFSFDGIKSYYPAGGLAQAASGDLFGLTSSGGYRNCINGCGTIFKITPEGDLTTVHSFSDSEGHSASSTLVLSSDGNFYGTTTEGGAYGGGTFFQVTTGGALTTLQNFTANGNGQTHNYSIKLQGPDGDFYGTSVLDGTYGLGTIFKITPAGALTTLCNFDGTNGAYPDSLVLGPDGSLYGTATGGLDGTPDGSVFRMTPQGELTTLRTFDGTNGLYPTVLSNGSDGNFYGTTTEGGAYGEGTIFRITPTGALTTLFNFPSFGVGYGGVVQATNGTFYGASDSGGADNDGTIFSLSVGLGPFVEMQPATGVAGGVIQILGTDLTGSTSVTFNGVAAAFSVVSKSLITARVPAGAGSGFLRVVTPNGTLSSNVPFREI
jgi:uncharacterized repeat protein (TIGR03803 family)